MNGVTRETALLLGFEGFARARIFGGRTPLFTVLLETPLSVLRLTDSSHFNPLIHSRRGSFRRMVVKS